MRPRAWPSGQRARVIFFARRWNAWFIANVAGCSAGFAYALAQEDVMIGGTDRLAMLALPKRRPKEAWTAPTPPPRAPWLGRLLARQQPTTYQRCLAVHIHYAATRSALS
jgi:hypothetical protein